MSTASTTSFASCWSRLGSLEPGRKRALIRETARLSPAGLAVVASKGRWTLAPHLRLLNRELLDFAAAVERRESPRLMVFMPPRHGKSVLTSMYFPAWLIGSHPDWRVILTSYEAEFAAE